MDKTELIFTDADFSEETDFKDRLRSQLFGNRGPALSMQSDHNGKKHSANNRFSRRTLNFEELEMVSAAGDSAQYWNDPTDKEERDSNNLLNRDAQSQWKNPFSGIDGKPPKI